MISGRQAGYPALSEPGLVFLAETSRSAVPSGRDSHSNMIDYILSGGLPRRQPGPSTGRSWNLHEFLLRR